MLPPFPASLPVYVSCCAYRQVFLGVRDYFNSAAFLEFPVIAFCVSMLKSILLQLLDNVPTIHDTNIHTIHT